MKSLLAGLLLLAAPAGAVSLNLGLPQDLEPEMSVCLTQACAGHLMAGYGSTFLHLVDSSSREIAGLKLTHEVQLDNVTWGSLMLKAVVPLGDLGIYLQRASDLAAPKQSDRLSPLSIAANLVSVGGGCGFPLIAGQLQSKVVCGVGGQVKIPLPNLLAGNPTSN